MVGRKEMEKKEGRKEIHERKEGRLERWSDLRMDERKEGGNEME